MFVFLLFVILAVIFFITPRNDKKSIEKLVRQSARYAVAAQQDASPVIALLHANYAAAYLYALKEIASDSQIHKASGIDVKKFTEHITNVQDMVTKKTAEKCPNFIGEVDSYLAEISGQST